MRKNNATPLADFAAKRKRVFGATIIGGGAIGFASCLLFFGIAGFKEASGRGGSHAPGIDLEFYTYTLPLSVEMTTMLVVSVFFRKIEGALSRNFDRPETVWSIRLIFAVFAVMFVNLGWLLAYLLIRRALVSL